MERLQVVPHVFATTILGLSKELWFSFMVMLFLTIIVAIVAHKAKKTDPLSRPKGILLLFEVIYDMVAGYIDSLTEGKLKSMYPYFFTIAFFIFISNLSGLFGFEPPTSYLGVTLALAMITIGAVHVTAVKKNGFLGYWKRYIDPIPVLLPLNIVGNISPLISLSLRLCINVMSGGIILSMVYTVTAALSSSLLSFLGPSLSQLNVIGPFLTPVLHFYFDLFSGLIQTLVFLTLTVIFISLEVED